MHRQLEDGIFVSTPPTSLPCFLPLPLLCSPLPTLSYRLWHCCLDYHFGSKRGLTKVSMATEQSVNHAAADGSSPSLFPFSPSFFPNLPRVHTLFSDTHAYLFCISSSLSDQNVKSLCLDQNYALCLTFTLHPLSPCFPSILNSLY